MANIDNVEEIRTNDPDNMYNRIFDFPEQIIDAIRIGNRWSIDVDLFSGIKNIVVAGMGGSAIGGELARSYLASRIQVPIDICRNYSLPEYVDDESLVIVSSYSGNTEEVLSAAEDALNRKAMMIGVTTGGLLKDVCQLNEVPMAEIPKGLQPRAALGYSFVPLVMFFEKVGLVKGVAKEVKEAAEGLMKYRENYIEDNPTESNPAKNLAQRISNRIPIIYASPTITDAVATRFKCQIAENGKNLAYHNWFPEFNHNELVGYSENARQHAERLLVVFLRDAGDHPQIRNRMNAVKEIIKGCDIEVAEIHSRGSSVLERIFSLVHMADFTSYYLGILNGFNPTPVDTIENLKTTLAEKRVSV